MATRLTGLVPPGIQGIGWVAASTWGTQAIRLGALAVLANYLSPATFGFFAFALAIFTVIQPIAGLGVSGAIVVVPTLRRDTVMSGLALAIVGGVIGMALLFSGLMVLRRLDPQLPQFVSLGWMVLGLLLANVANAALAVPRRARRFSLLALATLAGEATGSAVGIIMAVRGYGLESLIFRYLATAAVMAVGGLWFIRAEFAVPSLNSARELLRCGWPVAGSETLVALRNRGDELLIGALFGATLLGIYSIARRYVDALRAALLSVIGDHAWPVLASLRDHHRAFDQQLRRSLLLVAGFVWPAFVALAMLASQWVPMILGTEWRGAIPVVWVLSIVALIQSGLAIPVLAMVGLGHTAARFRIDAFLTIITFAMIVIGSQLGLRGLLAGLILANLTTLPYQVRVLDRHLPSPIGGFMPPLLVPLAANVLLIVLLALLVSSSVSPVGPFFVCVAGFAIAGLVPMTLAMRRKTLRSR